jgi:hypothetical protein
MRKALQRLKIILSHLNHELLTMCELIASILLTLAIFVLFVWHLVKVTIAAR